MDFAKYFAVLVILFPDSGETGGHGEKHHDHIKLHIPEFIHHDHHTKVITIHHHHKPKKEHHHHHHHHHHTKPHIPHSHHYHHHKKAHTTTHTVSKGHNSHHGLKSHHGHHGQQGHGHHEKHGHQYHHGHTHYGYGNHQDTPSYSYEPPSVPSFGEEYANSITPSIPAYGGGIGQQTPQVHGVTHTVKQVKVYDSLPGVLPTNTGSNSYQVTENSEDTDDDVFTSINSLQQTYPMTYGYVRDLSVQPPSRENVAEFTPQYTNQGHESFAAVAHPTTSFAEEESYTGTGQSVPFFPATPNEYSGGPSALSSAELPTTFQVSNGEQDNQLTGVGGDIGSFVDSEESFHGEVPVTFARIAGIQRKIKTEGVETVEY